MEKILIVGARGFIGQVVMAQFGEKAVGIDIKSSENVFAVDITKKEELEKFFEENKLSACIDFAGISLPLVCAENRALAHKINVEGQRNLLEVCAKNNVDYYYSSTVRLYDSDEGIATEESEVKATNYYTETKLLAEKQIREFFDSGKLKKAVIFRFSNTFGKDPNIERLIPTIISSLKNGSIELTNAKTKFDLLYAKDIPRAIEIVMGKAKGFEIFNVASGKQLTMDEIATWISLKLSNGSKIKIKDQKELLRPGISIEKIKSIGFVPTEFEKAISSIISFY
jgi:dTDP-4-dehydrorhamnose reductase